MDIINFVSSSEGEPTNDGRQNFSTDADHSIRTKTKQIRKRYQPLNEDGRFYKYEDDPSQYKRIRKKIQNRQSATRVRGRKKNAYENLQQEVEHLRKDNSELHLHNAKLVTQNKALRQQLQFVKGLVKPSKDSIQQYLTPETMSNSQTINEYQSPFIDEESDWVRTSNRISNANSWMSLAFFTIVIAVMIIPDNPTEVSTIIIGQQIGLTDYQPLSFNLQTYLSTFYLIIKGIMKAIIILGYIWFFFIFLQQKIKKNKVKKV